MQRDSQSLKQKFHSVQAVPSDLFPKSTIQMTGRKISIQWINLISSLM
jgi:hypothetical protein